jgi:DNA-binding NtrC family response regulator
MARAADKFSFDAVVTGPSAQMRAVFDAARMASANDSTVVLVGEIGTGKELIARTIHEASAFKHGPFVAVRCEASDLVQGLTCTCGSAGELPVHQGTNLFERAAGGTLLLGGIDRLPLNAQAGLAHALRERRVASCTACSPSAGTRIIATSRQNLSQLVADGRFDHDLQLQLSVVTIAIPPLRERREDILPLARHFLAAASERRGQPTPTVPAHIDRALVEYRWPGNVRELENLCERMVDTCAGGTVRAECLAPEIALDEDLDSDSAVTSSPDDLVATPLSVSLDDRLREVEAELIAWARRAAKGNKSRAAARLRIKRTTLADRIARHGPSLFAAAGLATRADAEPVPELRPS